MRRMFLIIMNFWNIFLLEFYDSKLFIIEYLILNVRAEIDWLLCYTYIYFISNIIVQSFYNFYWNIHIFFF